MENHKVDALIEGLQGVLRKTNQNVKIFKTANHMSIMDVTSALNYHKDNNKGEDVYKGKVIFSITESQSKKYLKAFVDKAKAKLLAQSLIDHTFGEKVFVGGFSDFGGTVSSDPSKIRSRVLKITKTEKGQIAFRIEEGKGMIKDKGSIQMVGKAETVVSRFVPYEEALQLAHELHAFIRDQEMLAMLKGQPLFTISRYEPKNQQEVFEQAEPPVQEEPQIVEQEEKAIYVIQTGPWKDRTIDTLSNEELKYILEKTKGLEEPIAKELFNEAVTEAKKRMNKQSAS